MVSCPGKETLKMSPDLEAPPLPPPKNEESHVHIVEPAEIGHHAISRPEHKSPPLQPLPRTPSPVHKPVTYSPFPPSRTGTPTPGGPSFIPPSRKPTPTPTLTGPSRNGTPAPDAPAAQFIANLSDQQRAHLQFAVPKSESDRLSHFLEEPRRTPVPDRFMFEALDSEARSTRELNSKVRRGDTKKSHFYHKSPKSVGSSRSSRTSRSRSRSTSLRAPRESVTGGSSKRTSRTSSRGRSFESIPKSRPHLKTEVRHFKGVAMEVDWRFYATGVCLAFVNLALAWDSTAISIALPVRFLVTHWNDHVLTRSRRWRWPCTVPQ